MIQEKITVEILGRSYELDIEGLTPMEASVVAGQVTDKMLEIQQQVRVVDTSRIAVLAALNFADELRRLQAKYEQTVDALSRRGATIRKLLEEALKNEPK